MRNTKEWKCVPLLEKGIMNVKATGTARGAHLRKITRITAARASVHPALES
jgi:hypothetical protein